MTPRQLPSRGRRCVPSTPAASPAEDRSRLGARAHLGLELGRAPIDGAAALDRHRRRRSVRHGNRRGRGPRAIRRQFPSLPVVVYTLARIRAFERDRAVGEIGCRARRAQPVRRRTSTISGVARRHSRSRSSATECCRSWRNRCRRLPVIVVRAIDQLFRSPARFKNAGDLAAAAGMNLRTLYRNLEPAGILLGESVGGIGTAGTGVCFLAGPGSVDQGRGGKGGIPLALAALAAAARDDGTNDGAGAARNDTRKHSIALLAEQVRRTEAEE